MTLGSRPDGRTAEEIQEELKIYGEPPGREWLKAYQSAYPLRPFEVVAHAELSTCDVDTNLHFGFVDGGMMQMFSWSNTAYAWKWLVFADEPAAVS